MKRDKIAFKDFYFIPRRPDKIGVLQQAVQELN